MGKMILLTFLFVGCSFSQTISPDLIIKNTKDAFSVVKDYTVDASVKIEANFIKVPEMNVKIFFKQPDKIQIQSKEFAMLPKTGLNYSPSSLFNGKYSSFYVKEDTVDGEKTYVVKIIPLEDNGDIILTTLWIDKKKFVIRKIESSTKTNGTFTILLNYDFLANKYPLPVSMIFSFDVNRMNMVPRGEENRREAINQMPKNIMGKVIVTYSNYKVNKGVPDQIFNFHNK